MAIESPLQSESTDVAHNLLCLHSFSVSDLPPAKRVAVCYRYAICFSRFAICLINDFHVDLTAFCLLNLLDITPN
jgi:hypothetical protein